jgi:hypothetical protein
MWQRDDSYMQVIREAWGDSEPATDMLRLHDRMKKVQESLQGWDFNVFGSVRKTLARLRRELEHTRGQSIGAGPSRKEKRLMSRISKLLSREEIMEKQRSRIDWLKYGDRNTAFFQAKAKERAKTNRIVALQCEDGSVATKQEELEACAVDFYQQLFAAQNNLEPEAILQHVPSKVTDLMNESLIRPFCAEEVEKAIFKMSPNKAPGPDGLTTGFYQKHWDILGPSVTAAVLHFLNGGDMVEDMNRTTIALIPKIKNPQSLKQFRPISLCNVIYKICSKVLANRMRGFLDEIISKEQSTFVPGRLITDNVLIAYECTHYLKRKKARKEHVQLSWIWRKHMIGWSGIIYKGLC